MCTQNFEAHDTILLEQLCGRADTLSLYCMKRYVTVEAAVERPEAAAAQR